MAESKYYYKMRSRRSNRLYHPRMWVMVLFYLCGLFLTMLFTYKTHIVHSTKTTTTSPNSLVPLLQNFAQKLGQRRRRRPALGFTMQDFEHRVLNRDPGSKKKTVLVVSDDAIVAARRSEVSNSNRRLYSTGGSLAQYAVREGHTIHAVHGRDHITLDGWWQSFSTTSQSSSSTVGDDYYWWSSASNGLAPKSIHCAIFDLEFGKQDRLWREASGFLNESSMDFVVFSVQARRDGKVDGLAAAQKLLEHRYKLQIMRTSHYDDRTDEEDRSMFEKYGPSGLLKTLKKVLFGKYGLKHDHLKTVEEVPFENYGPNVLLRTVEEVKGFLEWGAKAANKFGTGDGHFHAYLFATQGLDLAIPSRRIYLNDTSRVQGHETRTQVNLYKPLTFKVCPQSQVTSHSLEVSFDMWRGDVVIMVETANETDSMKRMYHPNARSETGYSTLGQSKSNLEDSGEVELWHDNKDIATSEAACARWSNLSRCTTRVNPSIPTRKAQHSNQSNVVLLMVQSTSRGQFDRSMKETKEILKEMDFIRFEEYTSVDSDSDANQAALYSGVPLDSTGFESDRKRKWLWDRLNDAGYTTLKSWNGCKGNSARSESGEANRTHGKALTQLFCFDFDRPNCIGPDQASSLLLGYGEKFIKAYAKKGPWAAFLHFVDAQEDTMTLSGVLDSHMAAFLRNLKGKLENTVIILCSDHGLQYGAFSKTLGGRKERVEPVLYIRPPQRSGMSQDVLELNAKRRTTPFDLHKLLLSWTGLLSTGSEELHGESLLETLPMNRNKCTTTRDIPNDVCALLDSKTIGSSRDSKCTRQPMPPSVPSFFADIPTSNRPRAAIKCNNVLFGSLPSQASLFNMFCKCATSHRKWYRCYQHPWGRKGVQSTQYPEEYFAMIKCWGFQLSIDTRILRSNLMRIASERKIHVHPPEASTPRAQPNILFIEVDSVSRAYSNRHFQLTKQFMQDHRARQSGDKVECSGKLCAFDFDLIGLAGPNSISNQVAAFSGCLVNRFNESCLEGQYDSHGGHCTTGGMYRLPNNECVPCPKGTYLADPISGCTGDDKSCCTSSFEGYNQTRICQDPNRLENNLQLFRRGPRRHNTWCPVGGSNPFIFDHAKKLGYVTYFGEEICYERSVYVPQNNIFPLFADFEPQSIYCNAEEMIPGKIEGEFLNSCSSRGTANRHESLNPNFDHLLALWDAAPDIPKLAFMNAVAAHDDSQAWLDKIANAERFDEQLYTFLSMLTKRNDFSNTIIILRSDHGVQCGPATTDYSFQVEHRQPWTQILLSADMARSLPSLRTVYDNQSRLVTGYDIYVTLRNIIDAKGSSESSASPAIPEWSFDLLNQEVPHDRTCRDAKIPSDFCPCEEEAPIRPPNWGVCNPFDAYGDMFCVDSDDIILPEFLEV